MLLHIGYHKTATTWLQKHVFFAADNDAFHVLTPRAGHPRELANHFVRAADEGLLSPFDDNQTAVADALQATLQATRGMPGTPVLSDERLSGNPHAGGFDAARIATALHASFPGADVLIVIREQKAMTLSCYFQYLSIGGTRSLETYMLDRYDRRIPGFSFANLDYLLLVERYRALWGAERVHVLPYELFAACPRAFLDRLERITGRTIRVPESSLRVRENANLRPGAAYSLRWLNRFRFCASVNDYSPWCTPLTRAAANAGFRLLSKLGSRARDARLLEHLRAKIEARVGDRFGESNARLAALCDLDLARYGYC